VGFLNKVFCWIGLFNKFFKFSFSIYGFGGVFG